jgi:alkanesulfonate monooxygenase SsuD/methylene tetrahydromethanopterin reductase-like flavin-dependent oxidoreductase (luciferase family)/predicted kinase
VTGLPDPALVVLVGASGSGKSTWALERYRSQEVVSSDDLRGVVGSGRHDLDASDDAFTLLDQIVAARVGRGLTTVVDTLGLDPARRTSYVEKARAAGLPAVAVVFETPDALCRERNAARERPVPAPALASQLKKVRDLDVAGEGWDHVLQVSSAEPAPAPTQRPAEPQPDQEREVILQVSRFPWGGDPAGWLRSVALAADEAGFTGIALMDHLIQIPQVDRAWEPIPEPFTTLGLLAGLDTDLRLGTLCTPVTFRPAGIIAKTVATLDVITNGRAFVGIGAGWFGREHEGFGLPFPSPRARLDEVERTIETMRALWAKGTKAYDGTRVNLPETTSYPRPVGTPQIIVGGNGEKRTLRIAAELGDACNLPTTDVFERRLAVFEGYRERAGRTVRTTVLDLPVLGRDREDVWHRVERLRGNTAAAAYAKRHHAATYEQAAERYRALFDRGVSTIFVALPDLAGPDDVLALRALTTRCL